MLTFWRKESGENGSGKGLTSSYGSMTNNSKWPTKTE